MSPQAISVPVLLLLSFSWAATEYEANLSGSMARDMISPVSKDKGSGLTDDQTEGLPAMPHPAKFHTVNPSQIEQETKLVQQVKDKMKETYHRLMTGKPFDEDIKVAGPTDQVTDKVQLAKEKAKKKLDAAKVEAQEKTKKETMKAKEKLKKKNKIAAMKAKEKARKKTRSVMPLKGGPIQQAAMARYDAYKTHLEASEFAVKYAKQEIPKAELDRMDALAKHKKERAQYYEAQAIKQEIVKARSREKSEKAALDAKQTMDKADKKADAIAEVQGKKEEKPWECTPETCKQKCKRNERCLQWCSKCVSMKTEVMEYDPISHKLLVKHMRAQNSGPNVRVPDIVAEGKRHLRKITEREDAAKAWVEQKVKDVKDELARKAPPKSEEGSNPEPDQQESKPSQKNESKDKKATKKTNAPGTPQPQPIKQKDAPSSDVLDWASGVKKPSEDKEIAAEVHLKVHERQGAMIHLGNQVGDEYLENQRGKKVDTRDTSDNASNDD